MSRPGWRVGLLALLAAALLAAMLWTWLGLERGEIRSRHGVGAAGGAGPEGSSGAGA